MADQKPIRPAAEPYDDMELRAIRWCIETGPFGVPRRLLATIDALRVEFDVLRDIDALEAQVLPSEPWLEPRHLHVVRDDQ